MIKSCDEIGAFYKLSMVFLKSNIFSNKTKINYKTLASDGV
jgi:hypothetical protein